MRKNNVLAIMLMIMALVLWAVAFVLMYQRSNAKNNISLPHRSFYASTVSPTVHNTDKTISPGSQNAVVSGVSTGTPDGIVMQTATATQTVIATQTPIVTETPVVTKTPYPTIAPTSSPTSKPTGEPPKDLASIDFSSKYFTISDMNSEYKTQGRCPVRTFVHTSTKKQLPAVLLNFPASAFSFNAYCEGTVKMELYTPSLWSSDGIYFNVLVDGQKVSSRSNYKLTGRRMHTITLATNLEKGLHTFTIERQSEVTLGSVYVCSVSLNGEIAKAPAKGDYFIEFVGDSLISGYGILYPNASEGEYSSNPASSAYQDATKAFAYLTAKKLNADYSLVAESGIGIIKSYGSRIMSETYAATCAQCYDNTLWDFNRNANVVVISLGTNDNVMASKGIITYEQMQQAFIDFLVQIRQRNPYAKVVWAYGAMGLGAKKYVLNALEEVGGEENGYYYVELQYNGDAGAGHPSMAANEKNADTLTKALTTILGK